MEVEPHNAMTNKPEESTEKDSGRKNKIKVTSNSKILKNKSKDRDKMWPDVIQIFIISLYLVVSRSITFLC